MKDGAVRRFVFRTFGVKWNVKALWWATHRLVCGLVVIVDPTLRVVVIRKHTGAFGRE